MIKKVLLVVIMGAMVATLMGQTQSTLPEHVEGTSKAMQALDNEVRGWRNIHVTTEQFDNMVARIQKQINKNKNDQADGYLRLGQIYRMTYCPERCNDSLAKVYYLKAEQLLNRECDKPFLNVMEFFLGRCYMTHGENQNMYIAQKHLLNNIKSNPQNTSTLGDFYLFGWVGVTDLYLATQLYMLGSLNGCLDLAYDLEYLRHTIAHNDHLKMHPECYELIEDHVMTSTMENNFKASLYPLELAAQMGNPSARCNLAKHYRKKRIGNNDEERVAKAYELLKDTTQWDFIPMKYEMAILCLNNDLDPTTGKHYPLDDKGSPLLEAQKIGTEKCIRMLEEMAVNGFLSAMNTLAEIYADQNDNPAVEPNYERAQFWIKTIENMGALGHNVFARQLQKYINNKHIWDNEADSIFMASNAQNFALENWFNIENLYEQIDQVKDFKHPSRREHVQIKLGVTDEMLAERNKNHITKGTASDYIRADAYEALYKYYEWKLQRMFNNEEPTNSHMRRFCQQMMRSIRKHSEAIPFNLIKQSEWEAWNGR